MSARFEVGQVRARDGCSRADSIERAKIPEEARVIMRNAGDKKLCSPHMHCDPRAAAWIKICRMAESMREAVFLVVLMVLCSTEPALEGMRNNRLLYLAEDSAWEKRFEMLTREIGMQRFFKTITKQDAQRTTPELKLEAVYTWRCYMLRTAESIVKKLCGRSLRMFIEANTPKAMHFGDLKAYVAC